MNKLSRPCFRAVTACVLFAALLLCFGTGTNAQETAKTAKKQPDPIRYIVCDGRRYVNLEDIGRFYKMTCGENSNGPVLYSKTNRVDFQRGKRAGSINRIAVTFLFAPVQQNGVYYISELDFMKFLDPVLRKK